MKILFNRQLEALYGIDYCLNRGQNIIKQSENPEEKSFFDELYQIFLEKVPETTREDVAQIGDYHNIAEYVLNPQKALPDLTAFDDFFERADRLHDRIVADIAGSSDIDNLHLDGLKDFFGIDESIEINIILSMFVKSGFGVFNGSSNFILGVEYDAQVGRYEIANDVTNEIYHDFAEPYVHMYLYEEGIHTASSPDASYIEEIITRVLATIFQSRLYGEEFIERTLAAQDKTSLSQMRIFLSEYLENQASIKTLKDYVDVLLKDGLVVK